MKKSTISKLLQKNNPIILEIGTSTGEDTLGFLKEFLNIQLYCFEPDPRCVEIHKSKVNDPRCNLDQIAISELDGEATFYQSSGSYEGSSDWLQSSSLKAPKNHLKVHPWCKFENQVTVPTRKLDSWFAENPLEVIDFIWADVQGAEKNLIRGATNTLAHTKYFYTEYEDDELYEGQVTLEEIKALLPNFKAIGYFGNNVLFKNTAMPASVFNNAKLTVWQTWSLFPPKVWLQSLKRKLKF
jgi:2-O-methyltransferase